MSKASNASDIHANVLLSSKQDISNASVHTDWVQYGNLEMPITIFDIPVCPHTCAFAAQRDFDFPGDMLLQRTR